MEQLLSRPSPFGNETGLVVKKDQHVISVIPIYLFFLGVLASGEFQPSPIVNLL